VRVTFSDLYAALDRYRARWAARLDADPAD
jgi:hypothetical protein